MSDLKPMLETDPSYALRHKVRSGRRHESLHRARASSDIAETTTHTLRGRITLHLQPKMLTRCLTLRGTPQNPQVRMGDVGGVRNLLKAGEADIMGKGQTEREWTPLHIAVWGTRKPDNDKDIIEALLIAAQKLGPAKEKEIRDAVDKAAEPCTPLDLARTRRDGIVQVPGAEEGGALDEKRKYDKIVEWHVCGVLQPQPVLALRATAAAAAADGNGACLCHLVCIGRLEKGLPAA